MYVATSGIYGSGSVYALDLARRHSRRLMPEGESGSRTEARFTITKFDEEAGRLEVVRKEEGRRKKMVIEVASQASRAGVRLLAGSGASPGDASTAAGSVTVIRPENNGGMNLIPCKLVLRRSTGLLSAAVTHVDGQRPAPIDDLKSLDLIGGDTLTLSVRPGKYSLSVVTPISEQPQGYRGKAHVWRSETLNVTVTKQGNVRVSILPTSAGPAYNGGWKIRQLSADETPSKARGQP